METKSKTNITVPVFFKWLSVEADPRPYKPGKPILEPISLVVEVLVPITHEYISNSETLLNNSLTNQKAVQPILTTKGLKYCIDELLNAYDVPEPETDEDDWSDKESADDFIEDAKDNRPL